MEEEEGEEKEEQVEEEEQAAAVAGAVVAMEGEIEGEQEVVKTGGEMREAEMQQQESARERTDRQTDRQKHLNHLNKMYLHVLVLTKFMGGAGGKDDGSAESTDWIC